MPIPILYRESSDPPIPQETVIKGDRLTNLEVDANFKAIENAFKNIEQILEECCGLETGGDFSFVDPDLNDSGGGDVNDNTDNTDNTDTQEQSSEEDTDNTNNTEEVLSDYWDGEWDLENQDADPDIRQNDQQTQIGYSDQRLKINIQPIQDPLERLNEVEGVSFKWKNDNQPSIGVIAQQIEPTFPQLVSVNRNTGMKMVNYNGLIGVLIEAIKSLDKEVTSLEEKLK